MDTIIAKSLGKEVPLYEWENPFPMTKKEEAEIRNLNADVAIKMQTMQIADSVIANKLFEYGLINEDEKKIVENEFNLESFEIEDEPISEED